MRTDAGWDPFFDYDDDRIRASICRINGGYNVYLNLEALLDLSFGLKGLVYEFKLYEDISIVTNSSVALVDCNPVVRIDICVVADDDLSKETFRRSRELTIQQGIRVDMYHSRSEIELEYLRLRKQYDDGRREPVTIFDKLIVHWVEDSFFLS